MATEGEVIDLEIRQLGLGSIAGTVTTGGAPVAAIEVDLTSTTGLGGALSNLRAMATTDASGAFVFDGVSVGSFTVEATADNLTGTATGSIDADGQSVTDVEVALEPSGTVIGTVFRADAATAVPGAPITLRPPRGVLRTDANVTGDYRLELVPVGDFTVSADEPGGPDGGIAPVRTLNEGEELSVDIVCNGTGTVSGTAFGSDGVTPLTSGTVRLTRSAPATKRDSPFSCATLQLQFDVVQLLLENRTLVERLLVPLRLF